MLPSVETLGTPPETLETFRKPFRKPLRPLPPEIAEQKAMHQSFGEILVPSAFSIIIVRSGGFSDDSRVVNNKILGMLPSAETLGTPPETLGNPLETPPETPWTCPPETAEKKAMH